MQNKKISVKTIFFTTAILLLSGLCFYLELVPALGTKNRTEELIETIWCTDVYTYGKMTITNNNLGLAQGRAYSFQDFPCLFYETENGERMIQNLDLWEHEIISSEEEKRIERWEITDVYRLGFIQKKEKHHYYKIYLNREGFDE